MAISPGQLVRYGLNSGPLQSAAAGALFPDVWAGDPASTAWVELWNTSTLTLASPVAWIVPTSGSLYEVALAVGPIATTAVFTPPSVASLSFTSPSTAATGLSLGATLPGGSKVLLAYRLTPPATADLDLQSAPLMVGGSSPL